jgi:hypothetical protein
MCICNPVICAESNLIIFILQHIQLYNKFINVKLKHWNFYKRLLRFIQNVKRSVISDFQVFLHKAKAVETFTQL